MAGEEGDRRVAQKQRDVQKGRQEGEGERQSGELSRDSCCPVTVQGAQQPLGEASLLTHGGRAGGVFLHQSPSFPGPWLLHL